MLAKPNRNQRDMLTRRGYNWRDYWVVRATLICVWFKHKRTGAIKILNKGSDNL